MTPLRITNVQLSSAHAGAAADGLIGFVSCVVDDHLRLDGIALRRTLDGRTVLSFPERRDRAGRAHSYFHPVDDGARRAIEGAVFSAIGLDPRPTCRPAPPDVRLDSRPDGAPGGRGRPPKGPTG